MNDRLSKTQIDRFTLCISFALVSFFHFVLVILFTLLTCLLTAFIIDDRFSISTVRVW